MEKSIIAWTDHTFNPWMGCQKVSAGCKNCYAETLTRNRMGIRDIWGPHSRRQRTSEANWKKPLQWEKAAAQTGTRLRVFCASLADIFEDHDSPSLAPWRRDLFALIRETPHLDWQLLTKRPQNIRTMLPPDWGTGYPNVWLGTSIEDERVIHRADMLRDVPAAVRFISYEPALGPLSSLNLRGIDWLIYGGESGPGFRPHELDWAREIKAKCESSRTAFFYKQGAAFRTEMLIELDGEVIRNYPEPRRLPALQGVLL